MKRVNPNPKRKPKWQKIVYPLLNLPDDWLQKPMSRIDCMIWLEKNYPGHRVPKSACIGCPFHSNDQWREIQLDPVMWADACEVDEALRRPGADKPGASAYLHRACRPLREMDFTTLEEQGQQSLQFNQECMGMCGV